MACGPAGAGGPGWRLRRVGLAARVRRRHDGSAIRHADHGHADRPARSAAHPDGIPGWTASHTIKNMTKSRFPVRSGTSDERQARAGLQLSESGRPASMITETTVTPKFWFKQPQASKYRNRGDQCAAGEPATRRTGAECASRRAMRARANEKQRGPARRSPHVRKRPGRTASRQFFVQVTDIHDNGPFAPHSGRRPDASCRPWCGSVTVLAAASGRGPGTAGPLLARGCNATGSDWRPATPARRAIARIFPAGRNHGARGRHGFVGRRSRFQAAGAGTARGRHVDRRGLSSESDEHSRCTKALEVYPTIEVIDRLYPPVGQEGRFPIPDRHHPGRNRDWPCRAGS